MEHFVFDFIDLIPAFAIGMGVWVGLRSCESWKLKKMLEKEKKEEKKELCEEHQAWVYDTESRITEYEKTGKVILYRGLYDHLKMHPAFDGWWEYYTKDMGNCPKCGVKLFQIINRKKEEFRERKIKNYDPGTIGGNNV